MITLLLSKQIFQLYLIMACGYFAVRSGLLKSGDSRTISVLLVYIVVPCTVLNAFQIDFTPETAKNFLLSVIAGIILHFLLFVFVGLSGKIFRYTPIEKASLIYSNAGNLIIPLVTAVLGEEWVIYASGFMLVQQFLFWSHGKILIQGIKKVEPAHFLKNINLLSCFAGLILFLLRIRMPSIIGDTMHSIASLIGPLSMLMLGMILAGTNIRKMITRRIWLVAFFKMVVQPALLVLVLKYSGLAGFSPDGTMILFISLLAVMAPSATSVTQLAQLYDREAPYALAINTITTAACLVSMPLLTALAYM